MIQLCGEAIVEPLFLSFLENGLYLNYRKKSNDSINKKESKNVIKNCRPNSRIHVFGKVVEIIFNFKLNYFLENKLFTEMAIRFFIGSFLHLATPFHYLRNT